MILFKNDYQDLEELIKIAIRKKVCNLCELHDCEDEDGYECDLVNPIIVTIKRRPPADNSCAGCKFVIDNPMDFRCIDCRRMHDDPRLKDYFEAAK